MISRQYNMKTNTEISFSNKLFKSGYSLDFTKKCNHIFTFGFQFLWLTGFFSIKQI